MTVGLSKDSSMYRAVMWSVVPPAAVSSFLVIAATDGKTISEVEDSD
jgi:hypothetical protein